MTGHYNRKSLHIPSHRIYIQYTIGVGTPGRYCETIVSSLKFASGQLFIVIWFIIVIAASYCYKAVISFHHLSKNISFCFKTVMPSIYASKFAYLYMEARGTSATVLLGTFPNFVLLLLISSLKSLISEPGMVCKDKCQLIHFMYL